MNSKNMMVSFRCLYILSSSTIHESGIIINHIMILISLYVKPVKLAIIINS